MWLIRKLKQRWKWSRIAKHNKDLDNELDYVRWMVLAGKDDFID